MSTATKIFNLSSLEFETDKPHHEVVVKLGEDSFFTLRRNFGRLQLVKVTSVCLQAGEFASKEEANLGTRVKNAQIVLKGQTVKNWNLLGLPIAREELDAFNAACSKEGDDKFVPEFSEEQFLMNVEARYEMGTTGQRKGQMTLEEWIPTESLVRNSVVDPQTKKVTLKEDGYVTGPIRDVAKKILRAVREGVFGPEWLKIMKSHENDGYVRVQDLTSKASESESEDVKASLKDAEDADQKPAKGVESKEGEI